MSTTDIADFTALLGADDWPMFCVITQGELRQAGLFTLLEDVIKALTAAHALHIAAANTPLPGSPAPAGVAFKDTPAERNSRALDWLLSSSLRLFLPPPSTFLPASILCILSLSLPHHVLLRCVAIQPSVAILPFRAAPHDTAVCGILSALRRTISPSFCLNVLPKSWTIPLAWHTLVSPTIILYLSDSRFVLADFPSNTKSHPKQGSLVFVLASDPAVPLLSSSRRFRAAHRFPSPSPVPTMPHATPIVSPPPRPAGCSRVHQCKRPTVERPNVTHKMRELRAFVDSPPPAYTHRGRNSPRAR
ncbi:hypothetical protein B0H10DRAFT_2448306 [Mycena sp. CBHHK59/15]|nr:hypothetical protein B0H10DRAFT_2448306 [Mycena sp. CBHHK59/15]